MYSRIIACAFAIVKAVHETVSEIDINNCWGGDIRAAIFCCDTNFGPLGNMDKCTDNDPFWFSQCCGESLTPALRSIMQFQSTPDSLKQDTNMVWRTTFAYLRNASIPGDYVELGVAAGSSALAVAGMLLELEAEWATLEIPAWSLPRLQMRRIWLYDAFGRGFPPGGVDDPAFAQSIDNDAWRYGGKYSVTPTEMQSKLQTAGWNTKERTIFKPGYFNETLQRHPKPKTIAFLNIDSDLYESTMCALDSLYDVVQTGGMIWFDDFGLFSGVRKAFFTFCQKRGIYPLLERTGYSSAFFFKGKEHNWPRWMLSYVDWRDMIHASS